MSPQLAEKLKATGLDPIVPMAVCAEVLGMSVQTVKNIARRGELDIIRVSERRTGIRRSVLDAFLASRKSAVAVAGKAPAKALGNMAKRQPEPAAGEAAA